MKTHLLGNGNQILSYSAYVVSPSQRVGRIESIKTITEAVSSYGMKESTRVAHNGADSVQKMDRSRYQDVPNYIFIDRG